MIEAFSAEERVEAFGEILTLRLDFHSITVIEGDLQMDMPEAALKLRTRRSHSLWSRVLWALFREHHPEVTLGQCLAMVMDKGKDGVKLGFAFGTLLERAFPLTTEDKKPKNAPKRSGRSQPSASVG
jgi:hypothetical protein